MHPMIHTLCGGVVLLCGGVASLAQATRPAAHPSTRPAVVGEDDPRQLLGERFTSAAAGISLRVPEGGQKVRRTGVGADLVVTYTNPDEQWTLKVSRVIYAKPMPLVTGPAPLLPDPQQASESGVLDLTAKALQGNVNCDILRKDRINLGKNDAGLVIARYSRGAQTWLHQLALIQSSPNTKNEPQSDAVYYAIDFETPSGHLASQKPEQADPSEQTAFGIFEAILDSVVLIDQRPIIEDQQNRIFRALSLQVNIPGRVRQAIIPEQYFRVLRNGKDAGWIAQFEEWGIRRDRKGNPTEGLIVARASEELVAETGTRLNKSEEMFCIPDRNKADEQWVTISTAERGGIKQQATEWGQSQKTTRTVLLEGNHIDAKGKLEPNAGIKEEYKLNVSVADQTAVRTTGRELPAYYLPAAEAAMIHRLIDFREQKGYLFLVWVPSEQQLINRFIDVGPLQEVKLDGKTVPAVVIKDRISLEGDPTFHYLSPTGQYLGSFAPATGMLVLPAQLQQLNQLYPNSKITRPSTLDTAGSGN